MDVSALLKVFAALREAQRMEEALIVVDQAANLEPGDARIAAMRAQLYFETGRPAAALFAEALTLAPGNLAILRGSAAALSSEGQGPAAQLLLETSLAAHPDWLDGHKMLASLRTVVGEGADFARGYAAACRAQPHNMALRLAWFHALSLARDWVGARAVIDAGEQLLGLQPAFTIAKIYIASESGDGADDAALFDPVADVQDAGLDLCHVRHALRGGRTTEAQAIAERHIGTPTAPIFWPYLSIIWRLLADPRAKWLDGDGSLIRSFDLGFSAAELDSLAVTLRKLHTMQAPYLEQSVRGGTQTDRPLFFSHDPVIQHAKARVIAAVEGYIAALPAPDPEHPLLGTARGPVTFEGSWSVLLKSQGYHSVHTHPVGWISSALYVSLPEPSQMGAPPAGWIEFGRPSAELGLDLPAYTRIEPKAGRLVLFPSTLWHGTVPFDDGERLTIAFDVRRPRK
jgi:Putative 2OG-Fe(II) oxygenase